MKSLNRALVNAVVLASSIGLVACSTNAYHRQPQTNATAEGVSAGAVTGAVIAGAATAGTGAVVGAAIGGGAVGGGVGFGMDQDESAIRAKLAQAGVSVVEVGYSNDIVLLMPSDIQFASGSAQLGPQFRSALDSVAEVMKEYQYTVADIPGHADVRGGYAYNQRLSMARAQAVADYLASQGVAPNRLVPQGYSKIYPVASNRTVRGRAMNRRVQIVLHAPDIRSPKFQKQN